VLHGTQRLVESMSMKDSTISFPLTPGAAAQLAMAFNTTYENTITKSDEASSRNNLIWMRIATAGDTVTYTPQSLSHATTLKKTGLTVLLIGP